MAAVSKEEYLKRYLSSDASGQKKKKKKKVKASNVRIIDDDVDLKTMAAPGAGQVEDPEDEEPTVAEIVDERPEHVKRLEQYRKDQRWKVLGKDKLDQDDEMSSKDYGVLTTGSSCLRHDSGSDASPPRRKRHDSDSDPSPPRRKRHDSDASPPRKRRHDSGSDASPPRRKRHVSGSDASPPRRKRHDSGSDASPPRKKRHDSDSDNSPVRQKRHDSDSDNASHRQNKSGVKGASLNADKNPRRPTERKKPSRFAPAEEPVKVARHDSDSDQSPARRGTKADSSPPQRKRHDIDSGSNQSIQRKRRTGREADQSPPRRKRRGSDSDQSPPRQRTRDDQSPPRRSDPSKRQEGAKPDKTLGGAKAGLSSAAEMRKEADKLRRKEEDTFAKIDKDALGQEARTVFRDRKSGKRRDLAAEQVEEEKDAKKKAQEDKKYEEWGQGLKQKELREQTMQDYVHEASKPLARYKDDEDMDRMLRDEDRAGDPMAKFLHKKAAKKEDPAKQKPRYRGPAPPPNRFKIMPGYRWDGVDRSNGFEKQIFTKMSEKKAIKEHAYKWSTEDM